MPDSIASPLFLETIRIEDGMAWHLDYHTKRLNQTYRAHFGSPKEIVLSELLTPPSDGLYRCRVIYGREVESIEYLPYTPKSINTISLVHCDDISYPYKYADRSALDALFASCGACDAVLIVKNGLLTDTAIANIAFLEHGKWITPEKPLLEGTTRNRLIDEGFLTPKAIRADEINRFDGFALMNAMIGFEIINPIWIKINKPQK